MAKSGLPGWLGLSLSHSLSHSQCRVSHKLKRLTETRCGLRKRSMSLVGGCRVGEWGARQMIEGGDSK